MKKNISAWWAQVLTLLVFEIGCVTGVSLSGGFDLWLLVQSVVLQGSLMLVACWKLPGLHPVLSFLVSDSGQAGRFACAQAPQTEGGAGRDLTCPRAVALLTNTFYFG